CVGDAYGSGLDVW
nr:immunoglobulin heavy chain junction region [Macaca mulatta]